MSSARLAAPLQRSTSLEIRSTAAAPLPGTPVCALQAAVLRCVALLASPRTFLATTQRKNKTTEKTTNKKGTHKKENTWRNTKQQHTKRTKESHRCASQTRSARQSGSQATDAQVQPCPVVCFAILRSAASKHPGARAKAGHCVRAASVRLALTI